MLSGGRVEEFGETPNQPLEHGAQLLVRHHVGVRFDRRELLGHQIQQVGLVQPLDLRVEVEPLEAVTHRQRDRDAIQPSPDERPVIDIQSL